MRSSVVHKGTLVSSRTVTSEGPGTPESAGTFWSKCQGEAVPIHAMKVHRWSEGMTPLILNPRHYMTVNGK